MNRARATSLLQLATLAMTASIPGLAEVMGPPPMPTPRAPKRYDPSTMRALVGGDGIGVYEIPLADLADATSDAWFGRRIVDLGGVEHIERKGKRKLTRRERKAKGARR